MRKILSVQHLSITYHHEDVTPIVSDVSFDIHEGEFVALMGRSGIGKSLTAQAILGFLHAQHWELSGDIIFYDRAEPDISNTSHDNEPSPINDANEEKYILRDGRYDLDVIAALRGQKIVTVFQEPSTYLHPSLRVGQQIKETIKESTDKKEIVAQRLQAVKLEGENPYNLARKFAHQFSQGQRQRIMLAMTLNQPALLIADEPTSSLDIDVQKEIINLLRELRASGELKSALVITHDVRVIEQLLDEDDSIILLDGRSGEAATIVDSRRAKEVWARFSDLSTAKIEESGDTNSEDKFTPSSPWTRPKDIMRSYQTGYLVKDFGRQNAPIEQRKNFLFHPPSPCFAERQTAWESPMNIQDKCNTESKENDKALLLEVVGLSQTYREGWLGKSTEILQDINFEIRESEILGIVGRSGSGKTTLAKAILRLLNHTIGNVFFHSQRYGRIDLVAIQPNGLKPDCPQMKALREEIQFIFQDAAAAFNPRMTVFEILAETLEMAGIQSHAEKLTEMRNWLSLVNILRDESEFQAVLNKYASELSGGQKQRLAIARAIAMKARLIIADEPFANQDWLTISELEKLIKEIQEKRNVSFLLISHDLDFLQKICDRILVIKNRTAQVVEQIDEEQWAL